MRLRDVLSGIALALSPYVSIAHAAPAISEISGGAAEGSTLTLSGSGFGSGYVSPLLWDDFEASSSATGATMSASPRIGSWERGGNATYSTGQKHSGSRALHAAFSNSSQWSNFHVALPDGTRFYQSFWFWWSSTATNGQLKLALVHGNSGMGEFAPTVNNNCSTTTWWMTNVATESAAGMYGASWANNPGPGMWHHFEMALQQSSGGGATNGSVTVWVDGQQYYSRTNIVTRDSAAYHWDEMGFFRGVTNMSSPTDTYLDDVYASTSWARVVLCDAATYAGCANREVQPASSWSDTTIEVTLAKSAFPASATLYVYVIDQNGVASLQGFPLCTSCSDAVPAAPASLHVD
jgi:hypothetical protein